GNPPSITCVTPTRMLPLSSTAAAAAGTNAITSDQSHLPARPGEAVARGTGDGSWSGAMRRPTYTRISGDRHPATIRMARPAMLEAVELEARKVTSASGAAPYRQYLANAARG